MPAGQRQQQKTLILLVNANKGRLLLVNARYLVAERNGRVKQLDRQLFLRLFFVFIYLLFLSQRAEIFVPLPSVPSAYSILIRSLLLSALFHISFSPRAWNSLFYIFFLFIFFVCFVYVVFSRLLQSFDTNNSAKNKLNRVQKIHHHFLSLRTRP